ncbi:MAG: glutamate--tRNA ligase [Anaerolineae bacterium]|nr:glutamate--tRNA ligase [Anaerolineae bacterium]
MTDKIVRTRFAPSPTGPLHIGGVRSALFSWLLARHHGGKFILRIEDTDQKRFVEGSIDLITDALSWLGIDYDEGPGKDGGYGPYIQSERLPLYQKWAQWLIDNDKAYRCFCTPERLDQVNKEKEARKEPPGYDRFCRNLSQAEIEKNLAEGKPHVIRLKVPLEGQTTGQDLIRGEVVFDNNTLQDAVLLKSDGYPTYHLAHVIDDHFMEISHVTRANEWLPSLPLHLLLWEAFGWEKPYYAHLPVLLNPNGKGKLSKRHSGFSEDGKKVLVLAKEFKDAGYLPEAVVNFLTNIGWNFGDEREIFDIQEAIARFDISAVNPANSAFPIEKLDWMNGVYIREKLSSEELAKRLRPILENAGLEVNVDRLLKIMPLIRERIKSLNDIVDLAGFFFHETFKPPTAEMLIPKKMDKDGTRKLLEASHARYSVVSETEFLTTPLLTIGAGLVSDLGLNNSQVFGVLRVAVTGQSISTPTFETMEILGKDESLKRIQIAVDLLK